MRTGMKVVAFTTTSIIWSSTWIMIKVGLYGAPPFLSAGLRFIIASLVIFAIVGIARIRVPRDGAFIKLTLFLGLANFILPYAFVYWAEQHISSGLTAILISTIPLNVALLSRVFLGDPLTFEKIAGIAVATFGVFVIFSDNVTLAGRESILAMVAVLGAAFWAGAGTVAAKKYSAPYNPFASILPSMTFAGVALTTLSLVVERGKTININVLTATSILYLAIFGSVIAFALWFWVIKHMDATVLSYQTFIIPILACLIGWIFLQETITIRVVIGGLLILSGIALAVFSPVHRKRLKGARS